jgi:hypothetical protein
MPNISILTKQNIIDNYVKQEFFSNKNILVITNPEYLKSISPTFDLESILEIQFNELDPSCSVVILEFSSLEALRKMCNALISYNSNSEDAENKSIVEFKAISYGVEIGNTKYVDMLVKEEFLKIKKPPVFFDIQRTATKIPVIGVGGGSMSNLFSCRYVLNSKRQLKRAIFIKQQGDLNNSKNQALVPVVENDIIVNIQGTKPLDLNNSEIKVQLLRIVVIDQTKVECEDISERLDNSYIPKKVIEGAHTYQNRDGSYFCLEVKAKTEVSNKKVREETVE